MRTSTLLELSAAAMVATACMAACSSKSDNATSGTTSGTTSGGTTTTGSTTGGGGMTGSGGAGSTTSGMGGTTTTAGTGGSTTSTTSGSGAGGAAPMLTNGCSKATAVDMTNTKQVIITDKAPWTLTHQFCVLVNGGTQIVFNGSPGTFVSHPLVGGVVPTADAASPVTIAAKPVNGTQGTQVSFQLPPDQGKQYPYFCNVHTSSMEGVIYTK